jgi:uncharacterized membrane protein
MFLFPPNAVFALRLANAGCYVVAFAAALLILLSSPALQKSDGKSAMRFSLFVFGIVAFVVALGAAMYFFPLR